MANNLDDDSSADEWEDATGLTPSAGGTSMNLSCAIKDVDNAINLFFNNQFGEAKKLCAEKSSTSIYHSIGKSTLLYLEAVMTFDAKDIEVAITSIKQGLSLCENMRKKQNLVGRLVGTSTNTYTEDELHAEVIYAELNLFYAMLTFIQDESVMNLVKGALKMKQGYNSYKKCECLDQDMSNMCNNKHFQGAINLGCGCFNIGMSLLPARVVAILKWIGFDSDKKIGLQQLSDCYLNSNVRSSLSSLFVLGYHLFICSFVGTAELECDVELCTSIVDKMLNKYPNGIYFHFFAGRIQQFVGDFDKAIEHLVKASSLQNEWQQFSHFCYWELMCCHIYKLQYKKAAEYAELLVEQSNWSKCLYTYLQACFLYENDRTDSKVMELMLSVQSKKKKVSGKSLPIEKFVCRKARKFIEQGGRLVAPTMEFIAVWNQVSMLKNNPELRFQHLTKICNELDELNAMKKEQNKHLDNNLSRHETGKCFYYYDDFCLLEKLKGNLMEAGEKYSVAEICYNGVKENYKYIVKDHYVAASAMADLSMLLVKQEKFEEAQHIAKYAKKNYSHYSMESRIHFRLHAVTSYVKTGSKQ